MDKLQLAESLARMSMEAHGLADWAFRFSHSHKWLGRCFYRRKLIVLSRYHVLHDTMDKVFDTIKHEVAHALVGYEAGHGPEWQAKAIELGATPQACCNDTSMPSTWTSVCSTCSKKYSKHRILKRRLNAYHCTVCGPVRGRLTWVRN